MKKPLPIASPATAEPPPKPLTQLIPRGAMSPGTWAKIQTEQAQMGFGWTPLARGAAAHILTFLAIATTAYLFSAIPVAAVPATIAAIAMIAVLYRGLENLVHGAAHDDVCRRNAKLNDALANFIFAFPVGQSVAAFRVLHMEGHHARFGGADDPCANRMRSRPDVQAGGLPRMGIALRHVVGDFLAYLHTVGARPTNILRAIAWQLVGVYGPVALLFGMAPAMIAYLAVMPLSLGVVLPVIRALAEAGEHDYAIDGSWSVVGRTFDNVGVLNGLLHPFGDGWHALHHLAPRVPQARLGKLMGELLRCDPLFAAYVHRRTGVLTRPEPYRPVPVQLPPAKPEAPINDNNPAQSKREVM